MFRDNEMSWDGGFPYDVLKPAGITPASSNNDIQLSVRHFASLESVTDAREARNILRIVKDRLAVDFFYYRLKPPVSPGSTILEGEKHE